jgi:hypothetical protein
VRLLLVPARWLVFTALTLAPSEIFGPQRASLAGHSNNHTDRIARKDISMNPRHLFVAVPAAVLIFGNGVAHAGKTVEEAGALVCVTDKWDEKEPEKGHKLADAVMRCVDVPDDSAAPKYSQDCTGKYEYLPDGSWKSAGTCTDTYKSGDKKYETWEEGSQLKEYIYKITGGTGKYQGASGGGTYMYEALTDSLFGGKYKGTIELP